MIVEKMQHFVQYDISFIKSKEGNVIPNSFYVKLINETTEFNNILNSVDAFRIIQTTQKKYLIY